jgi:ribosomal protein L29
MSAEERNALEEELINLKKLLDFYVGFGHEIRSMTAREMEDHLDAVLDRINHINTVLGYEN